MKEFIVSQELDGIRLDKAIAIKYEELTRTLIQKLIDEEKIKVNNKIQKASYKVKQEDYVQIEEMEVKDIELVAEDIPLDIIYEDNDIVVVNKQKGLVVHPANGNPNGTLVNAIMAHCKDSLSGIGGEIRPGIVHRLDKDTSGLIIIAKNDKAHLNLSNQIKNREVKKTYIALVRGCIKENEATIDMPIARSLKDRKKMAVSKEGKNAITHYKVIERFDNKYTLLEVEIKTGRTHQIRVHLSHIGYPIIGDTTYSNGKNEFGINGQMLHAYKLTFCHPINGNIMNLEAPLPKYYEEILEKLRKRQYQIIT